MTRQEKLRWLKQQLEEFRTSEERRRGNREDRKRISMDLEEEDASLRRLNELMKGEDLDD
tara:strand:- start:372 stop:551 length:180 start_codon:yes stop_codon:yes gene_type:complete